MPDTFVQFAQGAFVGATAVAAIAALTGRTLIGVTIFGTAALLFLTFPLFVS